MRISDWSSDVCSSDLRPLAGKGGAGDALHRREIEGTGIVLDQPGGVQGVFRHEVLLLRLQPQRRQGAGAVDAADRKSVVEGKSVSGRVDLGGRSIIKKQRQK